MSSVTIIRTIHAPVDLVFQTISDIQNFSKVVPDIVKYEYLSDTKTGVGTRFRETRLMKGKEISTDLEVTEYHPNERIRMVTDSHGTVWDSVFTVHQKGKDTVLNLTMTANAYKIMPKLINPIMKGFFKKSLEKDVDAVKIYCETKS
jgi:carbon monoxide dehydrogenase subunit G